MIRHDFYKFIFNRPPLLPKDKELQHEADFLKHHEKFQHVLKEITQTDEQKNQTLKYVLRTTKEGNLISSEDLVKQITTSQEEKRAENFLEHAITVSNNLKFKEPNRLSTIFKAQYDIYDNDLSKTINLKEEALKYKDVVVTANPYYFDSVRKFASSLEASSYDCICLLIEFSKSQEMLVGMSISQQLSLGVGFKIYVLTYYTMKNPQSIIIFLNDVKTTMSDPRKSKLPMKLYNVVYEKRFIIGVGIASFALGNYLKGGELKYAVQECSKYMPQNEIVRNIFLEIRHFSGMIGFMISSILGEFRKGLWSGVFDGVPAVIKDFFKNILKNVPQEVIKDATKK